MRDAAKKEFKEELSSNRNWDELHERHSECLGLLAMHVGIGAVLENPEIRAEIKDPGTLVNNVRLLTKDIKERHQELEMIHAIHKDKHGGCTEDDIMLSFEVMEKYTQWLALMQSVVMPTAAHILEITSEAEKAVMQKKNLAAAQDPANSSPIDVEFTDTPSGQQQQVLEDGLESADHTKPQSE